MHHHTLPFDIHDVFLISFVLVLIWSSFSILVPLFSFLKHPLFLKPVRKSLECCFLIFFLFFRITMMIKRKINTASKIFDVWIFRVFRLLFMICKETQEFICLYAMITRHRIMEIVHPVFAECQIIFLTSDFSSLFKPLAVLLIFCSSCHDINLFTRTFLYFLHPSLRSCKYYSILCTIILVSNHFYFL